MTKNALDFLIVGAQKAGTTALHMQMRDHPQIALPTGKEAPYFNQERPDQEFAVFLERHFGHAGAAPKWGKVTPQYMSDRATVERIARCMPDVRLVACLRDPIQRAISHYNMVVRRGFERRSLDEALQECSSGDTLARSRHLAGVMQHEPSCYVAWGEYARILGYYLDAFPADRLLVVYFEDLVAHPAGVLHRIFDFVGVDRSFVPPNAGTRYYESAGGSRFPELKAALRKIDDSGLHKVLPAHWRDGARLRFRMMDERQRQRDTQPLATIVDLSDATRRRLVDLYNEDLSRLADRIRVEGRWSHLAPDVALIHPASASPESCTRQ